MSGMLISAISNSVYCILKYLYWTLVYFYIKIISIGREWYIFLYKDDFYGQRQTQPMGSSFFACVSQYIYELVSGKVFWKSQQHILNYTIWM